MSYQFQVTALARTVDGTNVEGEGSVVDDSAIAIPGEQGTQALQICTQELHSFMHIHVYAVVVAISGCVFNVCTYIIPSSS